MLVAKYEPGKKGNQTHIVPATAGKLKTSYGVPNPNREIVAASGIRSESDTPLCTLFLTFSDAENKEVTTAHVFNNTNPRLYPQTRKTTYKTQRITGGNNSQMSLTSPSIYTDDETYERQRLESLANTKTSSTRSTPNRFYDNQLLQEVSLTYSSPYTAVVKPGEPLALQIGSSGANSIDEYSRVYEENGNLHSYVSDYDSKHSKYPISVKEVKSVERLLTSGKIETEFPVKNFGSKTTEEIPYFSAQSAIQSARTTPVQTPRATPVIDSRASTVRLPSALSQNTVISESTTIEELTTITTTNNRKTRNQQSESDMPTVNALTEQFEATARREKKNALKSRTSPNQIPITGNGGNSYANGNGNANKGQKSNSRVVVINRSDQYSNVNNNREIYNERSAYSPAGIVTTTIVDIEPPGYGRRARIEEYRIEEEWRSMKTYPTPHQEQHSGGNENYQTHQTTRKQTRTPSRNENQISREEAVEIFVRSQSRGPTPATPTPAHERILSADDTISQTSPTVRNVIEHFETRIEGTVRPNVVVEKENIPRSVSRIEMNRSSEDEQRREQEIIIARRELEQNFGSDGRITWTPKPRPVEAPPAVPAPVERVQPDFIRTFEEEKTTTIRMGGSHGSESRTIVSDPAPDSYFAPRKTVTPPPPTPASPIKQEERTIEEFITITTREEKKEETAEFVDVHEQTEDESYIIPSKTPEPTREYRPLQDTEVIHRHEQVDIEIRKEEIVEVPLKTEYEPEEKEEKNRKEEEERKRKEKEEEEEEAERKRKEDEETYEKFKRVWDRDVRVDTYEELSTTTRRREKSLPPFSSRNEIVQSSALSGISRPITGTQTSSYEAYRGRTTERDSGNRFIGISSGRSRATSEGRGFTGGTQLVSGLSSAGAICTTQIRDAREREKREIGLLNDRLADYIEKVRFLEAQNRVLSHDIDILRRGFSGGGHVSHLYETEISQAKRIIEQTVAGRASFNENVASLSAQIEDYKQKWLQAINVVKNHRADHSVDLDKLAKIEAEISLFRRKISIVEEDVIRIKRENDGIHHQIADLRAKTHREISAKSEFSLHIQDLLHRLKGLESENSIRIEQELVYIRRDTTPENRDYFRHELQAAIRDIRADYESVSLRNRTEIESWYRSEVAKIQQHHGRSDGYAYRDEIVSIRTTLGSVKSRLAELESRNYLLEKTIVDLSAQQNEESKLYEISLSEKDAAIARLREQCTELTIQMEKLCDTETSLRAEIEKYRVLLNGANVTTYTSNNLPAYTSTRQYSSVTVPSHATRVTEITSKSHTSSNTSYSNLHQSSRSSGGVGHISVGGHIGGESHGYSVGGHIGGSIASPVVGGNVARSSSVSTTSTVRPDRIHDDEGEDDNGRKFRSWYKGTIRVKQVTRDFVELENICIIRRVEVTGFRVEHRSNGELIDSATVNQHIILDPKQTLKVYTSSYLNAPPNAIRFNIDRLDDSTNSRTSIFNTIDPSEERGWFVYL